MMAEASRRGHLAARALNLTTALPDTTPLPPPMSPWHSQVRRGAFGKGKCSCVALPPFYIRLVGWITESGSSSPSRPHYAREGKRSEDFYKVVASRVLPLALAA